MQDLELRPEPTIGKLAEDYWLEMLVDGDYVPEARLKPLIKETNELIAIFVTMVNNVKSRAKR